MVVYVCFSYHVCFRTHCAAVMGIQLLFDIVFSMLGILLGVDIKTVQYD